MRPPSLRPLLALLALAALPRGPGRAEGLEDDSPEAVERKRRRCARPPDFPAVREPGDMQTRFASLLAGEAFAELRPQVISRDPLIVYFDEFMSEEEVAACEEVVFSQQFMKSKAGYGGKQVGRHSESAYCIKECDASEIVQTVQRRASNISGVPIDNFDFMQALRYQEGMYFAAHHDNHPSFHLLPCGTRIFSFFVYVSDAGLEGGSTEFPSLSISVPAKRGAAVLFANTKDDDPLRTDERARHESVAVTKGEKRGLNLWLYQYNYRHFWRLGCTSIEFADHLKRLGKAAVLGPGEAHDVPSLPIDAKPKVVFHNPGKMDLSIFWLNMEGKETLVDVARAGRMVSIDSFPGHAFVMRTPNGTAVTGYAVTAEPQQHAVLSTKDEGSREEL